MNYNCMNYKNTKEKKFDKVFYVKAKLHYVKNEECDNYIHMYFTIVF